eukprot:c21279_g2_i1.p1 GENE.c21279_g2_i1~~c21279_g2_i1.p1  ORF type:complete len:290 (+),score=103.48 c21279_g2_i1:42-872(+)
MNKLVLLLIFALSVNASQFFQNSLFKDVFPKQAITKDDTQKQGMGPAGMGAGMGMGPAPTCNQPLCCPQGQEPNAIVRDYSGEFGMSAHGNNFTFYSCDGKELLGSVQANMTGTRVCLPPNFSYSYSVSGGLSVPFVGLEVFDLSGPFNYSALDLAVSPYAGKSGPCLKCRPGSKAALAAIVFGPGSISSYSVQDCAGRQLFSRSLTAYDSFVGSPGKQGAPFIDSSAACFPKKFRVASSKVGSNVTADFYFLQWDYNAKEQVVGPSAAGVFSNCA